MLKRIITKAAICATLISVPICASAQGDREMIPEAPVAQTELTLPDNQAAVELQSQQINQAPTAQESEIARKMTQAEKARNAKENDSWGGAITIIAMTIVLSALIVLSILFYGFGKVSSWLLARKKKAATEKFKDHDGHDEEDLASGEAIAAISLALAEHFGQGHDIEDTILTIRKLRKAYSPWSSKIYNLRHVPSHKEHVAHNEALTSFRGWSSSTAK